MARKLTQQKRAAEQLQITVSEPLWGLGIVEITGHNIETAGREEVNGLLQSGWLLLQIYTLKYREDGIWRERPMAILGKPKTSNRQDAKV